MRLRHIEVFYAVYRGGSVTAAAHELNVSQPSVSKVLRHAEDQLGYLLFERKKGRLVPTPAADVLFGEVSEVYGLIRSLNRTAKNLGAGQGGHLRVGILPSLGLSVIPESIARLRSQFADVSFELDTLHTRDFARALYEREIDVAIGYRIAPSRIVPIDLGDSELLLASPEGLFPDDLDFAEPEMLSEGDFIGLRESGPSSQGLLDELDRRGVSLREVVVARTYYVALAMVRLGVGSTVVDHFTAAAMPSEGVVFRPFRTPFRTPLCAMVMEERRNDPLLDAYLTRVREVLRSVPVMGART